VPTSFPASLAVPLYGIRQQEATFPAKLLKPEVDVATAARVPEEEAGNGRNAICDGKSISALIPND
jgi:hypothetical protein